MEGKSRLGLIFIIFSIFSIIIYIILSSIDRYPKITEEGKLIILGILWMVYAVIFFVKLAGIVERANYQEKRIKEMNESIRRLERKING